MKRGSYSRVFRQFFLLFSVSLKTQRQFRYALSFGNSCAESIALMCTIETWSGTSDDLTHTRFRKFIVIIIRVIKRFLCSVFCLYSSCVRVSFICFVSFSSVLYRVCARVCVCCVKLSSCILLFHQSRTEHTIRLPLAPATVQI